MAIPKYIQIFANEFYPKIINLAAKSGIPLENNLSNLANNQEFRKQFIDVSHNVFSGAINSSAGFINLISLIFITPILVFYLLKDWDIFLQKIDEHLPKSIASEVKKIAKDINKTLSGYIRGQFNVCIILAIIYATLLTFSGLNFGFLIGFLTGICSFIPYIGMLGGVIAAIIVGFFQWGLDPVHGAIIGAIFIFGQIVESNFLTPKLIGHKVGLHPVWLIFGLFVFGSLFGFIGVIIAVPLTAIIGVIIKYFSTKYRQKYT
jgi:predicted PurR-regulated permease PerM